MQLIQSNSSFYNLKVMQETRDWKGDSSELFVSEFQKCISKVNPRLIYRALGRQKSETWIDQSEVMELLQISSSVEFRKLLPKVKKLGLITYEQQYIIRYFKPSVVSVKEKMYLK